MRTKLRNGERRELRSHLGWLSSLHPHSLVYSLVLWVLNMFSREKSPHAPDHRSECRVAPIMEVLLPFSQLSFPPKENKVNTQLWSVSPSTHPWAAPHHIASLFIPSLQTLSKLISKSWEHLIVLINPMPGEIWFCASEASRFFWIDSLFWLMPAFPI